MLQRRRRDAGGRPLVTFVHATGGERTELSAVSLENAAAKIANSLRDEFDVGPGSAVGLRLPLHWQRSTWCAGAWTAGCLMEPGSASADLVVTTADEAELAVAGGSRHAVVSLHPLGLPLREPLPPDVHDVTIIVRQQPDAYLFDPPTGSSPALRTGADVATQSELLDAARARGQSWGLATGGRLLVPHTASDDDAWLACLAVPLACDASVVMVAGGGDLQAVADQERVSAWVA